MKKIFFLFSLILISSCSKIQPLNQEISELKTFPWKENCWIHSCNLENYLLEKFKFFPEEENNLTRYQERLNVLINQFKTKDNLIKSEQFQKFVYDLNYEYFWCEWNIYECKVEKPYDYDKTNYLFYIYIPKLVTSLNLEEKWWTDSQIETVIQTIKREDFKTKVEKEIEVEKFIEKLNQYKDEIIKNNESIDFESFVFDYYEWLLNKILKEVYSIKIDWEEDDELETIMAYWEKIFFEILENYNISKNDFINKTQKLYWYNENQNIINSIINDLSNIRNYNIDQNITAVLPDDRYLRNDELANISELAKKYEIENENILELRNKVLLLFLLWKEDELYSLPNRLNKYNFEWKYLLTNIFKYSKYLNTSNIKK